jgi:hypothetical protein
MKESPALVRPQNSLLHVIVTFVLTVVNYYTSPFIYTEGSEIFHNSCIIFRKRIF